jgi:alkanesulfonate monooxygenase SsuD/methylene tetrahydromethanopterin reductase-like flavin-dependent oxidoreductase (luciferase family)
LFDFKADIDISLARVPAIEDKCRVKDEAYKRLKAELKELEALDRYELEIVQLKIKLLWLEVYAVDAVIEEQENNVNAKRENKETSRIALQDAQRGLSSIGSVEEVKDKIDDVRVRTEETMGEVNTRKQLVSDKSKDVNRLQSSLRALQNSAKNFSERMASRNSEVS